MRVTWQIGVTSMNALGGAVCDDYGVCHRNRDFRLEGSLPAKSGHSEMLLRNRERSSRLILRGRVTTQSTMMIVSGERAEIGFFFDAD
jgi:hypothetical protein